MRLRRSCSLFALVISISFANSACKSEGPADDGEAHPARAKERARQVDRGSEIAESARDALAKRMMGRVSEAVAAGGHTNAVEVCNKEAPAITRAVAEEYGVKIGRVSDRMRNAESRPPAWVEPIIAERPGLATQRRDGEGNLQAIFPILIAQPCLACHGAEEELAPGVKDALARLYPDDEATGYSIGDLRGWFWVEVPAS